MIKQIMTVLLAISLTACAALEGLMKDNIKEPEVTYKDISIGELSSEKIQLKPTFDIANKNAFTIPVDNIKYELVFNDKTMLNGETDKVGDLPANKSKEVTLALDLTKDTLLSIKEVLFKDGKIDYVVKGEVAVMGFTFPFEHAATIFKPSAKLGKLEVKKSSFKQIDMVVNVAVNNQNNFALPLDMLSYGVSSGKNKLFSGSLKDQVIKHGDNNIQIPVTVKPNELFSSVFALLKNPELPLDFNFSSGVFDSSMSQNLDLSKLIKVSNSNSGNKDDSVQKQALDTLKGLFQ